MKIISKRIIVLAVFIMVNLSAFSQSADLTNGWKLSPLGRRISLGDLPIHMVIDPTGKYAVVSNAGQSDQSLMVIDLASEKVVDSIPVKMTFYGMAFNKLGTELYSSGGNMNYVGHYGFNQGKLKWIDSIGIKEAWPEKVSPTGMVMGEDGQSLFSGRRPLGADLGDRHGGGVPAGVAAPEARADGVRAHLGRGARRLHADRPPPDPRGAAAGGPRRRDRRQHPRPGQFVGGAHERQPADERRRRGDDRPGQSRLGRRRAGERQHADGGRLDRQPRGQHP